MTMVYSMLAALCASRAHYFTARRRRRSFVLPFLSQHSGSVLCASEAPMPFCAAVPLEHRCPYRTGTRRSVPGIFCRAGIGSPLRACCADMRRGRVLCVPMTWALLSKSIMSRHESASLAFCGSKKPALKKLRASSFCAAREYGEDFSALISISKSGELSPSSIPSTSLLCGAMPPLS